MLFHCRLAGFQARPILISEKIGILWRVCEKGYGGSSGLKQLWDILDVLKMQW
jgi:hypothetical protein